MCFVDVPLVLYFLNGEHPKGYIMKTLLKLTDNYPKVKAVIVQIATAFKGL